MKFLKPDRIAKFTKILFRMTREDVLVWGSMALLLFAVSLVLWDGYLFYATLIRETEQEPEVKKIVVIDSVEIDEVIRLLDERAEKFEKALEE